MQAVRSVVVGFARIVVVLSLGILFAHAAPEVTVTVYTYKLQGAYILILILILTGLCLKIASDLVLWFAYCERAW